MAQQSSPIRDARVNAVLDGLHKRGRSELPGVVAHVAGRALRRLLTRKSGGGDPGRFDDVRYYNDKLICIDREQGALIYLLCRSLKATRIVEYGTSFGVSTLYLASAVRDNGGGTVIGTELEPSKVRAARKNFEDAGLSSLIDLREGDALETLKDCGGPVDFLLIDGWPKLAATVVTLVAPQLRSRAIVLCDEAAYRGVVRDPANGFVSVHLPLFRGTEISVKV